MGDKEQQGSRRRLGSSLDVEWVGSAICSGSFGEVLQGVRRGGQKFLVNLKIKNYARVAAYLSRGTYRPRNENRNWKSYRLVRKLLADLGHSRNCYLEIQSNIPIGKGLSSSTADMVASAKALERALGVTFEDDFLAREITAIEPNDGLHYPGTAFYEHANGVLIHTTPFVPRFRILGVDFGGEVDTLEFNKTAGAYDESDRSRFEELFQELTDAYAAQDHLKIAAVATESGRLSQKVLHKPYFDAFCEAALGCSALGVVNTHSGTCLGMVFDREIPDYPQTLERIYRSFGNVEIELFETITY